MPWSIQRRDGRYCVVKDADGEVEGCHDARADALRQQAALYAQEGRTAGLEIDTTALMEEFFPEPDPPPVRIEVGAAPNEASTALIASLEAITARLLALEAKEDKITEILSLLAHGQAEDRETVRSLVAALSQEPPVVTVNVPDTPVTVNVPEPVVNVNVPTPEVTVNMPSSQRQIKLERDPFGHITGALVEDDLGG